MAFPKLSNGMISGRLRPSEKRKVSKRSAKNGVTSPACELCRNTTWQLGDYLVTPEGLARHSANTLLSAPGDPAHPSVLLICSNCGNTKLINVAVLNAFDVMDEQGSPDD